MCFLQAKHLLAEVQEIGEKCIERSGRYAAAVVDGIDRRRRILRRKDVVETGCSEVLMNRLHRTEEYFRDAVLAGDLQIRSIAGRGRPQVQQSQLLNHRGSIRTSLGIGYELNRGLVQILTIPFIVCEQERFVLSDWPAGGHAELIPLERRRRSNIEIVGRIERIVAEEFKGRATPLVGAGLRHDRHLSTRMFAVFGRVRIAENVEFTNGFHSQELLACASGLHVVFCSAAIFHPVQQKQGGMGAFNVHQHA